MKKILLSIPIGTAFSTTVAAPADMPVYYIRRGYSAIPLYLVALDHFGRELDKQKVIEGQPIMFNALPISLRLEMPLSDNNPPRPRMNCDVSYYWEFIPQA